jgi:hypothetical protein
MVYRRYTGKMTTARERYEQKTRVVTFRVSNEIFNQLEDIKAKSGLSNADLVKLGAGIAQEEIKTKLAEASGLEHRLAELRSALDEEHRRLKESIGVERKRKLEELDLKMATFKLFDRGWSTEQVRFKLGLSHEAAFRYLQEWGEMRKDKRVLDRELLRACLKRHIEKLKDDLRWAILLPSTPEGRMEELERLIDDWQHMLVAPSRLAKADKEFLLAEYSGKVLSAISRKATGQ